MAILRPLTFMFCLFQAMADANEHCVSGEPSEKGCAAAAAVNDDVSLVQKTTRLHKADEASDHVLPGDGAAYKKPDYCPDRETYQPAFHRTQTHQHSAHFAQVYDEWPTLGTALVVASRADGLHFYQAGEAEELPIYMGSFSPSVGLLRGPWESDYVKETTDSSGKSVVREYHIEDDEGDNQLVAMEGHTRYGNIFVAIGVCRGSSQVLSVPTIPGIRRGAWDTAPCLQVKDPTTGEIAKRPVMFVFDLTNTNQNWADPKPDYVIPLFELEAALHVTLFTTPFDDEREQLRAVITSGFHQGKGAVHGWTDKTARLLSPPIALRPKPAPASSGQAEPAYQRSSSFGQDTQFKGGWEVDYHYACTPANQKSVHAKKVVYPEGVVTWRPPKAPERIFVITSGVQGGVMVAEFTGVGTGVAPKIVEDLPADMDQGFSQLVGKTWIAGNGKLYTAMADWSRSGKINTKEGGLVIAELEDPDGVPKFVSSVRGIEMYKANRIVLLDAKGKHDGGANTKLAAVPLEQVPGRWALYDLTDPTKPCLAGMSEEGDKRVQETYCLEVLPHPNKFRVMLMGAPKDDKKDFSEWWYYDLKYEKNSEGVKWKSDKNI